MRFARTMVLSACVGAAVLLIDTSPADADGVRVNYASKSVRVHRLIKPAPAKPEAAETQRPIQVTKKVTKITKVIVVPYGINPYGNTTIYRLRHPGLKRPWASPRLYKRNRYAQKSHLWRSRIYTHPW